MNPGALQGAPHTHIATVYADAGSEAALLRDIGNAYPNITAIRVRDAIDRVAEVLGSIAAATSWGAAATLLTGFLVLIGAAVAVSCAPAQRRSSVSSGSPSILTRGIAFPQLANLKATSSVTRCQMSMILLCRSPAVITPLVR